MSVAVVTGSGGLIGSAASVFLLEKGFKVIGIDNDMRSYFFGDSASTKKSFQKLSSDFSDYHHHVIDIREYDTLEKLFESYNLDIELIIHTAAQPSHDWAAKEPLTDFGINAVGTLNLLELTRKYCPNSTFIFTSTNKVYGDRPNIAYQTGKRDESYKNIIIKELENRYEAYYADTMDLASIDESMNIDNSKHSIFGASKLSADILCQEYGKYFGMNVGIFRGGCLTGPNHASAELHGFLSYLVNCAIKNDNYRIFGYKGKQVRDNIHSSDLISLFWHYHLSPKKGEVYNIGGGRNNSVSILEAIEIINNYTGLNYQKYSFLNEPRQGDHIWYISDLTKVKNDFPDWEIKVSLEDTIKQIIDAIVI